MLPQHRRTPIPYIVLWFVVPLLLSWVPLSCSEEIVMRVAQYPARIYQNAPADVPVVQVTAYSNTTGNLTNFELRNDDATHFKIGRDGMIKTASVINFNVGRVFKFFVTAFHDQKSCPEVYCPDDLAGYKHVQVIVSEKNRYSPVFVKVPSSFPVYRYGVGDFTDAIEVMDADAEPYNSKVNIYAEPGQIALKYVTVDTSGKITLVRRIPESMDTMDLTLTAKDTGSPQRTAHTKVIIDILMVRQPQQFCLSSTATTITLCWKNPMPEVDFDGYIVQVRGAIERTDNIAVVSGHSEACYKMEGTRIGDQLIFLVKVKTTSFWYGDESERAFKKTGQVVTRECYTYRFSPCNFLTPCKNGGVCIPNETLVDGDIEGASRAPEYSCRCQDGWSGYNCTVKDVCRSNPCGDFGSCTQVAEDRYQCQCQNGYFGDRCQHFNTCLKEPCMNDGSCKIHDDGMYTCQCLPNFSGVNCQNPDPCSPDPCVKGQGSCIVVSANVKQCSCNDGFYGDFCQNEDVCVTSQPCLNGAKCVRTLDSYECQCPAGRMGKNCGLNNPCSVGPCQNGGTCLVTSDGNYRCDCTFGHAGPECQESLDSACVGVNCNNGTCVTDRFQTNKCDCDNGYYGDFCQMYEICLAIASPCSGRGQCVSRAVGDDPNFKTDYTCKCFPENYGNSCEYTNLCHPKKCTNGGQCVKTAANTFDCQCPNGEFNQVCPLADGCTQNRCLNGGTCNPSGPTGYTCMCQDGWLGQNCQEPNPCSPALNPCTLDSNCTVVGFPAVDGELQNYTSSCQCPEHKTGRYCQLNNPCRFTPCGANGQCFLTDLAKTSIREQALVNVYDLFTCGCYKGYTGRLCNIKSCDDVVCVNGGYCVNGQCVCPAQFTGSRCQDPVPDCIDGVPVSDPRCYCEGGEIKCSLNGCALDQLAFVTLGGDTICVNNTNITDTVTSAFDSVVRVCDDTYEVYSPTCDTRTHCSPTGQQDTSCQYFNSQCVDGQCTKYVEERLSCLDLKIKDDREWIKCAKSRLETMQGRVTHPSRLSATEVVGLADVVVGEIEAALQEQEVAQLAFNVIEGLSQVNMSVSREVERHNKTNTRLRGFLDDYTAQVSLNNGSVTLETNSFIVQATSVNASDNVDENEITFKPQLNNSQDMDMVAISLPKEILESSQYNISGATRVQFVGYKRSQLFTPIFDKDDLITVDRDVIENQRVISASVAGVTIKNLSEPVRIELPAIEKGINHTCVFWDEQNSTWSNVGLKTIYNSETGSITCLSDHLTSFAVIMSPTPEALRSQIGLTYITYIGSGISMCCLFLTILTYGLFRCLYGEKSGKILLQLCTSLLLLNVAFLVGSVDVSGFSNNVCTAIAIILHYFVLSTLLWMLVEAIEMYRAIVTVFTKYERFYLLKRCLVGWGVPAVIVAATASVDIEYYGMNTVDEDGNDDTKICFMTPGGENIAYYTSLLAPACLVVLVNTVVFILVVRVILRPRFQQQITNNTAPFTPAQVRGAFTVMFLLGVTWIFGPLAIGEAAIVFSYLFCISNSLQGFLIFVFRCLFNPEARLAWIQLYRTGTLKKRRGPIKSAYVDSSSSKDGHDASSTTRRLSNSANTNLTTSTNYTSGHSGSMKLPLFKGSMGGIHAHPHQLHTTNGWHPNLNGLKRDNGYTGSGNGNGIGNGNGSDCGVSVSISSGGGGGGSRGSRSGSSGDGSDLMDINSIQSSKHDSSMEKSDMKPCEAVSVDKKEPVTPDGYNDDFTHL